MKQKLLNIIATLNISALIYNCILAGILIFFGVAIVKIYDSSTWLMLAKMAFPVLFLLLLLNIILTKK